VNTGRGATNTKRADSTMTSTGEVPREMRLGSTVTAIAIEQVLAELGIHARLSGVVAKAQSIENGIIQPDSHGKRERSR
jgi:hypothetical protein